VPHGERLVNDESVFVDTGWITHADKTEGSGVMKIAITAKGTHLTDEVDPRFGRALFILVVDSETLDVEAMDNSANVNAFKGAGIQAATMIADKGVEVLLTGYCGPNAFRTLEAAGVKVVSDVEGTVGDAVAAYKSGSMSHSQGANVEGHW